MRDLGAQGDSWCCVRCQQNADNGDNHDLRKKDAALCSGNTIQGIQETTQTERVDI